MKTSITKTVTLFTALISVFLAGCSNDVDPKLKARKAKLEKDIAKDQAYLQKTAWNSAIRGAGMAVDYANKKLKYDDLENTGFDGRNAYTATQHMFGLQKELAEVDKEIRRQEMIAPEMLVDVMNVKHYDTSNPNVYSHNLHPGVVPPPTVCAPGHH